MADFDQTGRVDVPQSPKATANMANWAGAVVSLALLAGVGVWGYKLLVRDVSGVPIVRSTEGPMRVAPEVPGGRPADHLGLAVNSVAGTGVAEAPADRLLLAPKPVTLADEDAPSSQIVLPKPLRPRDAVQETVSLTSLSTDTIAPGSSNDAIQALADQIAGNASPLSGGAVVPSDNGETEVAALAATPVPAKRFQGGVAKSLRPNVRPSGLKAASIVVAAAEPAAVAAIDVDPSTIPTGTRLVQFGAYDSPETARKEWGKLDVKFSDFLNGKKRVIQRASSGGRIFYRLRAMGFDDISDARRFCSAIVAGKAECIPVVTR